MLRMWYPAAMADHELYNNYQVKTPSRLPVPIWAVYGTADTKITAEMMGGWQGCAVIDDEFAILEVDGNHLFHKEERARQDSMNWLLDAAKEKLGRKK